MNETITLLSDTTTHKQIKAYDFEMDPSGEWVTLVTLDGRYSRRVCDLVEVLKNPDLEQAPRKLYFEMLEFAQEHKS